MLNDMSKNKKKILLPIVFVLLLVIATIGITYAFFNYTRTENENRITTGRISFETTQGTTINLQNVFPISSTEAQTDTTNAKTLSITVTGDTDYTGGLEYIVTASDVNLTVGSGENAKTLPIAIEVDVANNGTGSLGTEEAGDYYANRNSYTVSKYKVEYDGTLEEDAHILVGYIAPNTEAGTIEGINGIINIKAYLDASKILISDTYNNGNTPTDELGTPASLGEGKKVFTTTEWNAIQGQTALSFKIKVESRQGIWVENPVKPTLYNIMKDSSQGTLSDFSKTSAQDGTSGVYETTEGATPIYYYRGAVDNNVKFGDYCWKAIRTTITGGVKLIYNGEAIGNQCTTQTGTGTMMNNESNIKFNNSRDNAAYVGYTYIDPTTSVETDSNMKQVIDAWYSSAIINNKIDDSKVETTTYCNDRSSRLNGSVIYYGANDRLSPAGSYSIVTPTLNCPNNSDNYSLKAGFITADEIAFAGGKMGSSNSTYYLYNNANYWSGSPYYFDGGYAREFNVYHGDFITGMVSGTNFGVRSVVSLVPGTIVTGGDGTPTNPYIVG